MDIRHPAVRKGWSMKNRIVALAFAASLLALPAAAQQPAKSKEVKKAPAPVFQVEKQQPRKRLETRFGDTRVSAVLLSRMVGLNDSPRVQQFDVNPFDQLGVSYPETRRTARQ